MVHLISSCSEPVARTDYDLPLRILSAKQQYMYSDDGVRYLDMRNNVHHGKIAISY